MAFYKNNVYSVLNNVKDTFPRSVAMTGTISAGAGSKIIVGVGTLFTTEIEVGDWLYVAADNEFRKVTAIKDDTHLSVDVGFTGAQAADVPRRTPASPYSEISAGIHTTAANGVLDGETLFSGQTAEFVRANKDNSGQRGLIDPILLDATGTIIQVVAIK